MNIFLVYLFASVQYAQRTLPMVPVTDSDPIDEMVRRKDRVSVCSSGLLSLAKFGPYLGYGMEDISAMKEVCPSY